MDCGDTDDEVQAVPVEQLEEQVDCPICGTQMGVSAIEQHVNECLGGAASTPPDSNFPSGFPSVPTTAHGNGSGNVQQWAELKMHQLDNLLQDLSGLNPKELQAACPFSNLPLACG
jgi:hypothetical protein